MKNLCPSNYIPNIDKIKNLIKEYIDWNCKIVVVGDFDVDGVCSVAIMYKTLNRMGAKCEAIIGDRFKDGYGLSKRIVDKVEEKGGDLIITLDIGINNREEIKYAKKKGIETIVIDHHLSDNPPECNYVDLKVNNGNYPFKLFSAAGITWKVCQYLLNDNLYYLLDIVAISTIADVVPLKGENRIIAKEGLQRLSSNPNLGLKMLQRVKGLEKKEMTTGRVGYILAPMINAQGRLYDNQKSFELLTTENEKKAKKIAEELNEVNKERQEISDKCLKKAKEQINEEDNIIVIKDDIPPGIVGLVAGDIKEELEKPAIVFGQPDKEGVCKGSGRSISPLHLKEDIIDQVRGLIEGGGGHSKAAGLSIKENNLNKFKKKVKRITKGIDYDLIKYDMKLDIDKININLVKELEIFQPTGMGNPSPKFLIDEHVTNASTTKSGKHLLFNMGGIDGIAFNMSNQMKELYDYGKIIASLDINKYQGNSSVQLKVKRILKD